MTTQRAVLAGRCFWGMQELFRQYDGVLSTRVGYTVGSVPHATYRNLAHNEAVEVIFESCAAQLSADPQSECWRPGD
jgi:peptide-methionine (S)-S-oxide reductase